MKNLETFKTITVMTLMAMFFVGLFVQTTSVLSTTQTSVHKILTNK